jgi:hypothetical protein
MNRMQFTPKEFEQTFEALAKKFALLLTESGLAEDVQDALLEALSYLEMEQILHLIAVLEAKYVVSKNKKVEADLVKKLEVVANEFAVRQKNRNDVLLRNLQTLSSRVTV